jgi:GNAT superfamily N-acetyltransferase
LTASEAALEAALAIIGSLPGADVHVARDATWVAGGRPIDSLNHVLRLELGGSDATIEARIDAIDDALRERDSVPATWWIGPSTAPGDLAKRLAGRGFVEAEPEYGMVLDLPVAAAATKPDDVEVVADDAGLDAFLAVMAGAYDWPGDGRSTAWAELYRQPEVGLDRAIRHVVVRQGGRPVACASLFAGDGHAFVTNVGTIPEARGRGLGTQATLAVLGIAASRGARQATLTASTMGRGVYARIGFRDDALLQRWINPA